ncbi:MAG: bifunctional phosphoribosyl-AMP cyclohydrolase/phosphoribosyl-ATP diphosphatase HisIE [Dehalococcoidia bacterium]|nr:bifunctional phosphoribosyl-AMP cyclohydrolase/phosphoribosyl-ATP diphosphatase HisIE [Dehalococcoidia bacterium]MDW8120584.1 bifunctional phosphoribosyl-AMP cyclohydrolase/phosphoribosyl-ATP diphosphatase HisIE [Chloroflexota bacterium]
MPTLKLDERGLIPAIAQDARTGQVLMLGWMSPGALKRTLEGGDAWFYSRSRADLWHKGEVSGTYLKVRRVWADCDGDTLLLQVEPTGPQVCHTGQPACFFTPVEALPTFERPPAGSGVLEDLFATIRQRQRDMPPDSYTARLLQEGTARIAQKVIEEAGETALSAAQGQKEAVAREAADLLYHLLVLLASVGLTPSAVWEELRARQR